MPEAQGRRPVLYLSGPMSGYPEWNFPAFARAARQLRRAGYTVVSPHELTMMDSEPPGARPWEEYLRMDLIEMLSKCQAVATLEELPGMKPSRGRKAECDCARSLGWDIYPVATWLQMEWIRHLESGDSLPARVPGEVAR